jgi:hypothetical protein
MKKQVLLVLLIYLLVTLDWSVPIPDIYFFILKIDFYYNMILESLGWRWRPNLLFHSLTYLHVEVTTEAMIGLVFKFFQESSATVYCPSK